MQIVKVGDIKIGDKRTFVVVAGPCVIEKEKTVLTIAEKIKKITEELKISYIFKTSYDKSNRTSIYSYRGPGLKKGLEILKKVKQKIGVPILTDVHCRTEIPYVAEVVDIIQIPAFLCRQTDLIIEAAKTSKPINIKKGQFVAPWDVKHIIEKVIYTGNKQVIITERGTTFGYNNLVVDFRVFPIVHNFGYPILFDATHSVQLPSSKGDKSGGDRNFVPILAKAAIAAGANGLFMEVHSEPSCALSDSESMLKLDSLKSILKDCVEIFKIVNR
ncbi:MAG: 3-deoxy-8-phosphooctulonate synthase [Endomicrobia bacterium]|nr:3-deoxy-8-phosphooctulonate synthase [Endomicrobiia bacterium]MDW8055262.1 3-deoxy-8-phosphooctulonate synthase [Elusimicrobiota bacterium]